MTQVKEDRLAARRARYAAKKDSLPVEKSGPFWSLGCIDRARAAIGLPAVADVLENAA